MSCTTSSKVIRQDSESVEDQLASEDSFTTVALPLLPVRSVCQQIPLSLSLTGRRVYVGCSGTQAGQNAKKPVSMGVDGQERNRKTK